MSFFLQMVLTGIMVGAVYALLAIGFVLIYKSSKVFNFAQGEFLLFGAYFGWMCLDPLKLPAFLSFILIVVISFALGMIVERLFMRKMIGQPILSAIMMTLAIAYMLTGVVYAIWGGGGETYPDIFKQEPIMIGQIMLQGEYILIAAIASAMVILLMIFFNHTDLGLAMMSTAESHPISQAMGINVKRVFAYSWAIAALTAGIGGALLANINGASPAFGAVGLKVFPVIVLGGLESLPGAIIGGIIIGLLEYLSMGYIDPYIMSFSSILPYIILIIILTIRPYGLFGLRRIERV